jgi:phosphohistidine swiveling domain-containing protein
MDEDQKIAQVSKLADDILAVVMNAEGIVPEEAISALAHVASIIAMELKMPEQVFAYCMKQCYQAVLEAEDGKEVH